MEKYYSAIGIAEGHQVYDIEGEIIDRYQKKEGLDFMEHVQLLYPGESFACILMGGCIGVDIIVEDNG